MARREPVIDIQLLVSALADPTARRAAARWLLAICAAGFAITLLVLEGLGYGLGRWVFALLVWTVLVYLPLRIAIDAAERAGTRARTRVDRRVAADPARYGRPAYLPHVVRALARRRVVLPRICTRHHGRVAEAAAVGVLERTGGGAGAVRLQEAAIGTVLAAVSAEAEAVSATAAGPDAQPIQARWEGARALGTLAALATILIAAYTDRWGRAPLVPELGDRDPDAFLAAAMDYCDEAALRVDALPWLEAPVPAMGAAALAQVQATWRAFVVAGLPAPRALEAFLSALLPRR